MRTLITVLALSAAGCMFDVPLAPEPVPWVLPEPGPAPCPLGFAEPPTVSEPLVCCVEPAASCIQ
jgi:hypothetical protein